MHSQEEKIQDLDIYRHSVAHILAFAVKRLFPSAKLGIGPSTEDGFYYDFDLEQPFSPDDLKKIEKEMKKIIKKKYPFEKQIVSKEEARKIFQERNEEYKLELLKEIAAETVTLYENGEFIDLCRGPHLEHSGRIKAFKLLRVAGAYWRGDENNKMLQRIYGTAFFNKEELKNYLHLMEEARKRDHRKLGKELDLFSFHEEGPGFVFWHPKGVSLFNALIGCWKELHKDYGEIKTPVILNEKLWHQSGHWDNYKENMYFVEIDEQNYAVKPMNCPGGILVYKEGITSYRDLPIKHAELGMVHRHERSGVLHGLFRVRQFTQDDAHIYCRPDQIEAEIIKIIDLIEVIYSTFGFEYQVELSTKPEKSIGSQEMWDKAEESLRTALENKKLDYKVNPGDGAFYGPKIDFHIKDCIGRSWQCGTIQLDFSMPERFDLSYIGTDGEKHRPVMIHRAILGSIERFVGILIEHYGGIFPLWLAPVQVLVIPIREQHEEFSREVKKELERKGLKVELDNRSEKVGYRIRNAELQKIPYVFIIGDKEIEEKKVSVRSKLAGDIGLYSIGEIVDKLEAEIKNKKQGIDRE